MRYNLKNRPANFNKLDKKHWCEGCAKYEEWFVGFERELREKLDQPEYSREYHYFAAEDVIHEVLGE